MNYSAGNKFSKHYSTCTVLFLYFQTQKLMGSNFLNDGQQNMQTKSYNFHKIPSEKFDCNEILKIGRQENGSPSLFDEEEIL